MAGSNTLRFDVIGDASSASRAFKDTAEGAALAARGAKQLSESLTLQSKSARASADATLALARSDSILRDAELQLAGAADEAGKQLGQQGRAAEEAAVKTRLASDAAKGGAGNFGLLASPMAALVGAGVALSPVLLTTGLGLGGLALAAKGAVAPILAAGTATAAQQQALAGLDPAQRAAYVSLGALKTQFSGFSKSLEPEVVTVFNKALGLTSGLLHDVQPVAAATGKALGTVVGQIDANFRTTQWTDFFSFMSKTAGPDIQLLGTLFVDLTNDLPPLLQDLQPVALELIKVADGAARITQQVAGLPADIDNLRQATDKFTAGVGQHLPAGNENIFQVVSGWIDWMGKHVPGGNKSLLDLASSAGKAATATAATGTAAAAAAPQVGTLAGDMALLNTSTTSTATALSAYNDAWAKIVGNSLSDQQAVLADEAAFSSFTQAVKTSGSQSLQARQAFVSYIQQVGAGISTLEQNGASVAQVNAEYEANIKRLQSLHDLTPQQQADVQGLIKDYDLWANSTAGLGRAVLAAAGYIGSNFEGELASLGKNIPGISSAVSGFADSILKTGTDSAASAGDRAALIADLEGAGIKAGAARALVQALQAQIDALHGKVVPISVQISEALINQVNAGGATNAVLRGGGFASGGLVQAAAGMLVTGGTPGRDSVLIRAMPGEVVVPTAMVNAGAVDHLRGHLPGFAAGGMPVPAQYQPRSGRGGYGGNAGSRKLSAGDQAIIAAIEANTAAVLAQPRGTAAALNSVSAAAASRGSYSTRR